MSAAAARAARAEASRPRGFDRVAAVYPLLEGLVYGQKLRRGRHAYLRELSACRRLLLLGEGNGRFLRELLAASPLAEVTVVEISPRMIASARSRLGAAQAARVRWVEASALCAALPAGHFDAVVTHYLFDLFEPSDQARLLQTGLGALRSGGLWQDAELIAGGQTRWHRHWNRLLLACSYRVMGTLCDFPARELAEHTHLFVKAGLAPLGERMTGGSVVARLWQKP